jgi:hypothetical protein
MVCAVAAQLRLQRYFEEAAASVTTRASQRVSISSHMLCAK